MSRRVVLALAAHPDDIELMMGGTLLLLKAGGWDLHYMNIANGSCGTATLDADEIVALRTAEARNVARRLGARFHPPLVPDIEIVYEAGLLRRVAAVMRAVAPSIVLAPSPQDYMEDHANASRLAVSAAFVRGMRNFVTDPPHDPVRNEMAVYHALPYGLRDGLRRKVRAEFYADISGMIDEKANLLALHRSQKEWLDESQGLDAYLETMREMSAEVGRMAGNLAYAEGWRRHLPLGLGSEEFDPLAEALAGRIQVDAAYRDGLEA